MNRRNLENIKPFISVLTIILTLLSIVFLQMEERRLGYSLLKMNREKKVLLEQKRAKEIQVAKYSRPQLMDQAGKKQFTFQKVQQNQIIHLSGADVDKKSLNKKEL